MNDNGIASAQKEARVVWNTFMQCYLKLLALLKKNNWNNKLVNNNITEK